MKACRNCAHFEHDPWDLVPDQPEAYCHVENRRTLADYRCDDWQPVPHGRMVVNYREKGK